MTDSSPYHLKLRGYGTHHAVLDLVEPGARLLDIGSAGGYLSALARDHKGARVTAVEPHPAACEEARARGLDVLEGDISSLLRDGALQRCAPVDQIMLADVLEHLPDPVVVLRALKSLLSTSGTAIVSLPNIGYVRARLRLLRGVWRYEETGIFDRTHLRFFTRATARQMLDEAGFQVEREIPIGPASYAVGQAGVRITRLRPELLASQLVILARRREVS